MGIQSSQTGYKQSCFDQRRDSGITGITSDGVSGPSIGLSILNQNNL